MSIVLEIQKSLDALGIQAWTATPDGALDFVNQFTCAYFGLEREALVRDGWQDVLHPSDVESTIINWKRALQTGGTYENEFRLLHRKDRSYRWHKALAKPFRSPDGTLLGWSGTNTDIDDVKRLLEIENATAARNRSPG